MQLGQLIAIAVVLTGCGGTQETPTAAPLERLLVSSRTELCSGVLADALAQARSPNYTWNHEQLDRTLRWSFGHNHDDCGSSVNGVAMWFEAIEALGQIGGDEAGLGLVASLRVSHGLEGDLERGASISEVTEEAMQALVAGSPYGSRVIHELLEWYASVGNCGLQQYRDPILAMVIAAGEEGVHTVSEYFPPSPGEPQCVPGWMLSEVLEEASPEVRASVIAQVSRPELYTDDLDWITEIADSSNGELRDALARQACFLALRLAQRSFDEHGESPQDAVADAFGACASHTEGTGRVVALQRRLTRWLISRGQAEDALVALSSMAREDVDDPWLTEVGTAVITARLSRSAPLEAAEMFEQLVAVIGADHPDLQLHRENLRLALTELVRRAISDRNDEVARNGITALEHIHGDSDELDALRVDTTILQITNIVDSGNCLPRDELLRLNDELRRAHAIINAKFRHDHELRGRHTEAFRRWRPFAGRCYRRGE